LSLFHFTREIPTGTLYHHRRKTPAAEFRPRSASKPQKAIFSMMLVLCVFSAFMFHPFLMLAATEEFKVSFAVFGPTELCLFLIIINGLLVRFGVRGLKGPCRISPDVAL
jgi:hypothetical protein